MGKYHFIAIGGIGMSGLAKYLLEDGHSVTGSDIQDSKYIDALRKLGADVYIGHKEENLPEDADAVIVSTAIKESNPELIKAKNLGLKIYHRSDLLKEIAESAQSSKKCFIGFAGTHGKTTTSGMASYVLEKANLKPSFVVGGIVPELNTNAQHKDGNCFVAELDESDGTLIKYHPDILVINNLEEDHLDFYKNGMSDIIKVFNSAIEEYQSYGISSNDNLKYVYYNGSIADWCNIKFAGAFIIYSLYNPSKMDYFYVADKNGDVDYNNKKYSRVLDLVIPEGVTKINNYAFSTFKFLNSVSLPSTLQEIGDYCFSDCTGIKEINIPGNVKKLGNGTFSDCTGIEEITLPNTLNELGNNVFSGCTNLVTANIPTVLESISGGLFRDCTSLTNITIPSGVTKIGASAFYNCESITSIEIPALVTEIGSNAFYGTSIKTITLPNVVTMGYGVFEQCKLLESIHIPGSLATLPNLTFKNCSKLKTVTFDTNHTASNDENGIYIKFTIGWEAFCCCTSLETITLPSYCEGINDSAFISCENLTTVNLPLKDTINQTYDLTIGKQAFASCVKLQSIVLPKGSHIIDELAFFNCYKLSYIVIPAGVEQIKANAFDGCYSLDKIYYELDEIDYAMIEIDPTNTALTDNKIY